MKKNIIIAITLVIFTIVYFPNTSFASIVKTPPAQDSLCSIPKTIQELFVYATCFLNMGLIPFIISLGLIIFLIGVMGYVRSGDNEEKRKMGRDLMLFGIVALFVMVGVWGFVRILYSTFIGGNFEINNNAPSGL